MKRLELDIAGCGDCPYCRLVYNFLNLNKSKYYCFHPQNMTSIDTKKNIEENGWPLSLDSCPLDDLVINRIPDERKYEVRFLTYKYNSGDGKCGIIECNKKFTDLRKAERYARKIKRILEHREGIKHYHYITHNDRIDKLEKALLDEFVHSGYISSYDGIYEIYKNRLK